MMIIFGRQKEVGVGLSRLTICSDCVVMLDYSESHRLLRGGSNVIIIDFSINHVNLKVNDEASDAEHERNDGLNDSIMEDYG